MASYLGYAVFGLLFVVKLAFCGEYCKVYDYLDSDGELAYCSYGCCGSGYDRHCCTNVGLIIGAVIGSLFGLCLLVSLICCCIQSSKKRSVPGNVIQPSNHTVVVTAVGNPPYRTNFESPGYYAYQPPPPYPAGGSAQMGPHPSPSYPGTSSGQTGNDKMGQQYPY